ncbi:hypothetical protein ACXYN8_02455 [Altererythrobacter sp. CAU 1778]
MTLVPAAFVLVMTALLSIGVIQTIGSGSIDTRSGRFGVIERTKKPIVFWSLIVAQMVLNSVLAYCIVIWALSK